MKIATPYDKKAEIIHNEFESVKYFKIYETENGKVSHSEILATMSGDLEMIIGMICMFEVDALICNNIGKEARTILEDEGVLLYTGFTGNPDSAVKFFMDGKF